MHLILYRCVLPHACVHHTGLVGGIPLALGVGVSWILFACCIARHKWRSLWSVSSSHVEELRHIEALSGKCAMASLSGHTSPVALRSLVFSQGGQWSPRPHCHYHRVVYVVVTVRKTGGD